MDSENWPYFGHQKVMSGIWPGKLAIFRTSNIDVRNIASFYWPYSAHLPGHIPDITEGRAMGLEPLSDILEVPINLTRQVVVLTSLFEKRRLKWYLVVVFVGLTYITLDSVNGLLKHP